jgi:hypothetical protein
VRQYRLTRGDGGFAIFPLPKGGTRFDVVITGRRMRTLVVRDVAVTSTPISEWTEDNMTTLGSAQAPLRPVITPTAPRTVNLSPAMLATSSQLHVGQTIVPGGKPYEVAVGNVDVQTGQLAKALDLPQGPLSVATFVKSGDPLSFADTMPQEGGDSFSVAALGTAYDDPGATSVIAPPLASASTITVANPTRRAGVGSGQIQVNLTGSLSGAYDVARLIVSDAHGVLVTQAVSGSGTVVLTVPAGSQAAAIDGTAVYSVALRAAGHAGGLRWVRAAGTVDMRSATSVQVTLALP